MVASAALLTAVLVALEVPAWGASDVIDLQDLEATQEMPVTVWIGGFDANEEVIRLGPRREPGPIVALVEVTASAARIVSAEVGLELGLAVDTIGFERDEPELRLSHDVLEFPAVAVGAHTQEHLSVDNVGGGVVAVERVEVVGGEADAFGIVAESCAGRRLGPGGSCEITVAFEPVGAGDASAVLAVYSTASGAPHTVALTGSGVQPTVLVPDLVGISLQEAEQAARAQGLSLQPKARGNADGAARVQTQDPASDTRVPAGTPVAVTVATPWWWVPWAVVGVLGSIAASALVRAAPRRSSRWVRRHVRIRPHVGVPVERSPEDLHPSKSYALQPVPGADSGTRAFHEEVTE